MLILGNLNHLLVLQKVIKIKCQCLIEKTVYHYQFGVKKVPPLVPLGLRKEREGITITGAYDANKPLYTKGLQSYR